jgi:phospholipid-translocating ATPase
VFSALFYFAPIALYQGAILVGYTTIYTMAPLFAIVLDQDISEDTALFYPELYKELTKGRTLSYKTFVKWLLISVYQGGLIMILGIWLFENEFIRIVSISFTALVFNELLMVAMEVTTWHTIMVIAQMVTMVVYVMSMWFLPTYFDVGFIGTIAFVWKVGLIIGVTLVPVYLHSRIKFYLDPPSYSKLS